MTADSSEAFVGQEQATGDPRWLWLPVCAWLASLCCALTITPTLDDWWAATPLTRMDSTAFLPHVFWRPIEIALRFLVGAWPESFLWGMHSVVMVGHGLGAWFLVKLGLRFTRSRVLSSWLATLFIISPAVMMAAWSLDSANQTWSTACGLGALWYRLKEPDRVIGPWLLWCVCALFWKESGAAWFIAAPLMAEGLLSLDGRLERPRVSEAAKSIALGMVVLVGYFAVRSALAADGMITAREGRYALNWSLVTTGKHVIMLLGAAWSTIETVSAISVMHRDLAVSVITGLLGLPLLAFALWHSRVRIRTVAFIFCMLGAGALMGPHAIFGRVSEMHTHPLLAATLVIFGVIVDQAALKSTFAKVALGMWVLGALGATGHKYATWLDTCRGAEQVRATLAAQWEGPPVQKVCSVWRKDRPQGYGSFSAGHYEAAGSGRAVMADWGWDPDFETVAVFNRERCPEPWTQAVIHFDEASGPTIERVGSAQAAP
tara:strand:+ start:67 stop:1533 length:1467 start_codon:yes stop_codon:yes gene_type:complete